MEKPVIYWFRRDLRLSDNAALNAATNLGKPVICVYIFDDTTAHSWQAGSASRWWLYYSLKQLTRQLQKLNTTLVFRRGDTQEVLQQIIDQTEAQSLYFTRHYEPYSVALEQELNNNLENKVDVRRFKGYLLHEPDQVLTQSGEPYKVFTPFYKSCMQQVHSYTPLKAPKSIPSYAKKLPSESIDDWELLPTQPNWAFQFNSHWNPGEVGAHKQLSEFIEQSINRYEDLRNRPDLAGTSRLSPHLHSGEISPRQVWTAIENSSHHYNSSESPYIRQLIWRDFSYQLLLHWPHFPSRPFREEFSKFPWKADKNLLACWQRGETGYPIVDAGMRELWTSGWMHNRVRMIVASFLVKDLLIPWQDGAAWFWDTLVDADLANNSAGWQWVAGCGADAAPYFRIFNPVLQGNKFDPQGDYIRKWIPELAKLPDKFIHSPWQTPGLILKECEIQLGKQYPLPIIDHAVARQRALNALNKMKKAG